MKTIDKKDLLMEHIMELKSKQADELLQIKEQFHSTLEQLNPLNLIKNTFTGLTTSPDIKSNMLNGAVNIASHFLSKNTILGVFQRPIKKILGNVLMTILNKISPKKEFQR